MKYIIQYTFPYEHRVKVGIEAESRDAVYYNAPPSAGHFSGDGYAVLGKAPILPGEQNHAVNFCRYADTVWLQCV